MRSTKKLTLSAILTALGSVVLIAGGYFGILDLTAAAFASLLVTFAYIEIGSPYTWLIWICTTLISAIALQANITWVEYLVAFGIYPIIKGAIERLGRPWWIPLKLLFANAAFVVVVLASSFLIGVPYFDSNLLWLNILTYVLTVVTFIVYDMCITACVKFYVVRLRPRFKKFLR